MKAKFLKMSLPAAVAVSFGVVATDLQAAMSFIQLTNNYFQIFDTLASSGKSKTLPAGWAIQEFGNADGQIQADNGSSTAGGIYSYGKSGSMNRALGSLRYDAMGNNDYGIFGAEFKNSSSGSINRLNVSYTGEEWRLGATGRQDALLFQYSLNASSLTDSKATWLNVSALNFLTPNTTGVGAHDGTLAVNQTQLSSSIGFLNIPVGGTFWVRWQDMQLPHGGPEDGLAVDNFSISAVPEVSTWAGALAATALLGRALWKRRFLGLGVA